MANQQPFSFGAPAASSSTPATTSAPLSFGMFSLPTSTTSAPLTGLFSSPATTAATGFSLPTTSGFSLTPSAAPTGFSQPASTAASGFSLPTSSAASGFALPSTTVASGFSLPTSSASTGFSLPTTSTSTGFSLPAATTASTGFSLPTASSTGFSLPTTTTAAAPATTGFSLPTATTASTGFSLPTTSTTSAFSLTPAPAKTEASKVSFNLPATTTSAPSGIPAFGAVAISTAASIPPPSTMAYAQIEELLNKWTTELAEQEKVFNTQVSQINSWDKLLAENSSKLLKLHATIKKVQQQQEKINYDLDLITSQKKELEDALAPLEKEYASASYHPDVQREKMYHTAENIDAQIKKMCEDVKETIEHVNEAARSEKMHPVVVIGRVLNAQMNSLQWVDENSSQLQAQIETMSRQLDSIKRDTDRSFISYT